MDLRKPFVLENCGCFYKISLKEYHKTTVMDVTTVIRKLWDFTVIDFGLSIIDKNGEIVKSNLQQENNTETDYVTEINDISDVDIQMEWCEGNYMVDEFYIVFQVGDKN